MLIDLLIFESGRTLDDVLLHRYHHHGEGIFKNPGS